MTENDFETLPKKEKETLFQKIKSFASGRSIWGKKPNTEPMLEVVNCIGMVEALRYAINEPGLILKKVFVESKDGHIELTIIAEIHQWEKRETGITIG